MAATRHALPSGGWFELRDYRELRARDRKTLLATVTADVQVDPNSGAMGGLGGSAAVAAAFGATEGLAAMLITAWELPYERDAPLPSTRPGVLDELQIPDYDAIAEAVEPAMDAIMPGRVDPSDHADPASPSGPASG